MFENLTPIERQVIMLMAGKADGVISIRELKAELFNTAGGRIMSIITATEPKMRKTGNPYNGRVLKLAYSQVRVGTDWENVVNNARERAGEDRDFVATEDKSWHKPVMNPKGGYSPFCEHKTNGDWYLRAVFDKHFASKFVDKVTGEEIQESDLEPFLVKSPPREAAFVTYKLDNILAYNANGQSRLVAA